MTARFEAQEIWSGTTHFKDAAGEKFAVATHGEANGDLVELWAFKNGTRLSSSTVNDDTDLGSVLVSSSFPTQMTGFGDQTGFKTYAATQLSGTLEFFKHKVNTF